MTKVLTIHGQQRGQRKTSHQSVAGQSPVSSALEISPRGQETLRYLNAVFDKVGHRLTENSIHPAIDVPC